MASPQSSLGEQIREELSCSICLELFTRPKVLPCMHTFCQDCLRDHARVRQPFECPNCRLQVTLPTQGVPGLPDNHLVANLCERISKQVKLPVNTPKPTQSENKCIFHPWEELKLYCEQCQLSVCTECMGGLHAGHRTTTPKKASQERRAAVQELVSEGRNLLETYFTFLRSLRDKEKVLIQHRQQTDKNINHTFNEMVQRLINMKEGLLSEVDQTHRQNVTAIEGQREMVLTQVSELAAVCDSAEDRLRQGGMDLPGQERSLTQVIGKYRTQAPLSLVHIQTRAAVFHPSDTRRLELGQVSLHSVRSPSISTPTHHATGLTYEYDSEYHLQGDQEKGHHQLERTTFGGKGSEQGKFDRPFGVTVSEDGEIFVADRGNQRIQIFTLQGTFVSEFETVISGGQNISPQTVAVDTEGNLWVVGNHGVADFAVLYTREGKVQTTIDLQQTRWSRGVAIDTRRNNIIVTQTKGEWGFCCGEVQVFRPDGKLVRTIGEEQGMKNPEYITVDRSGNILVSDCENSSVYVYDEDTNFLFSFGGEGSREGQLTYPRGICTDSSGNIVVADWGNSCVQLFDRRGRFLKHINTDMRQPWAVAMAPHGQLIVTDDANNTVTIFQRY